MSKFLFLFLSLLILAPLRSDDFQLINAGILGNSGEQGATLVLLGPQQVRSLGVVYDKYGSLWDRGGSGQLNRYALDGRLLATYPIEAAVNDSDKITAIGDQLVLLLNKQIYFLSIDATAGTKPTPLGLNADAISFGHVNNTIVVLQDGTLNFLDLATKAVTPVLITPLASDADGKPVSIRDFDLKPDRSVYAVIDNKVHLFQNGKEVTDNWPRPSPGGRIQWLGNYWYGQIGHGTIHRFNDEFEAAPGVVLGGGSGSFIGHVDENDELDGGGRGMAQLDEDTYAVGGAFGTIHILNWNEGKQQFDIIRRIGAFPSCHGIALSKQGDVWTHGGMWSWNDTPTSPRQNGTPFSEIGAVTMLPNDTYAMATTRGGMSVLSGNFTWQTYTPLPTEISHDLPRDLLQASVIYKNATKHNVLLLMNSQGLAYTFQVDTNGRYQKELGQIHLKNTPLVKHYNSLSLADDSTLMVAGDGIVLEMKRDGDTWTEGRRWNGWGKNAPDQRFGPEIYLNVDGNHIWVSDVTRHRVICFALDSGEPIATFGVTDQPGNDLAHLNTPQVIMGRGSRAVVFDSVNQRLVKLELVAKTP